jgi:hypothetical protein
MPTVVWCKCQQLYGATEFGISLGTNQQINTNHQLNEQVYLWIHLLGGRGSSHVHFIYLKEKNDLAKTKALVPNSIRIIMDRDNYIYLLILLQQRRYKLAEPA